MSLVSLPHKRKMSEVNIDKQNKWIVWKKHLGNDSTEDVIMNIHWTGFPNLYA